MVAPEDTAALRELVADKPEFKRIKIVLDALEHWITNVPGREQVREHGRQSGVDVLDFLEELPGRLEFGSAEQLICGYQPLGGLTTAEEAAEFESWNKLCRQAVDLADQPAHSDWMDLQKPANDLFADLAGFVGKRYRRYEFTKETRASRSRA